MNYLCTGFGEYMLSVKILEPLAWRYVKKKPMHKYGQSNAKSRKINEFRTSNQQSKGDPNGIRTIFNNFKM